MPVVRLKPKPKSEETPETGKKKVGRRSSLVQKPVKILSLPTEADEPVEDLSQLLIMIYGENKIGKTSLCSMFPDPLFLMFEPGGTGLRIKKRQVNSWEDFVEYVDLLENSELFDNVIIDTYARCYKYCVDWVCRTNKVKDPGDLSWGEGWRAIEDEFSKQIRRLSTQSTKGTGKRRGVIFLGHPEIAEIERYSGGKYHVIRPRMMKQAKHYIDEFADIIAYYGYFGDSRMLVIEGSDRVVAGHRHSFRFKTPSGEKVVSIPMGKSEKEAYKNLVSAFENRQTKVGELSTTALIDGAPVGRRSSR